MRRKEAVGKTRILTFTVILLIAFTGPGCRRRALRTSIIEANFIFEGRIQSIGDSKAPYVVQRPPNTFIVDVLKPLSPAAAEFAGQQVTVRVDPGSRIKPAAIRAGQTLVFFTRPIVYADTLTVAGYVDHPDARIASAAEQRPDLILQERLRTSTLVVSGRVADNGIQPYPIHDESEHGPNWQQAQIIIATAEKGKPPRRLDVVFPAATTFIWESSPKFQPRQTGIWLLRRTRDLGREAPWTALHPLDLQAVDQLDRIRRLLGTTGKAPDTKPGADPPAKDKNSRYPEERTK